MMHDHEDFEFPTNIKQIGSITDGFKIYMEDYVCTYLQQYAHSVDYEEKIALLVGRSFLIDKQEVLFISGAIQGKYSRYEDNMQVFTERTWEYAQEQMDLYFKGLEIVGWMYAQPGFGVFLNDQCVDFHTANFTKPYNVLFISDPVEKLSSFYTWNEELNDLAEAKGYIIYFDRNEGMHEYMLENRIVRLKVQDEPNMGRHHEKADKSIKLKRSEVQKNRSEQRKIINMLVSLTGVLLIVCFVMGAGLIQNEGRISTLETELSAVNSSYQILVGKMTEDTAQNVFAYQGDSQETANANANADSNVNISVTKPPAQTSGNEEKEEAKIQEIIQKPTQQSSAIQPKPEPLQADKEQKTEVQKTYTVQDGDTLSYISLKIYGTNSMTSKIMEENNLSDPDKIYSGKVLKLPEVSN